MLQCQVVGDPGGGGAQWVQAGCQTMYRQEGVGVGGITPLEV